MRVVLSVVFEPRALQATPNDLPMESVAEAKLRFEAELEFVQALANPEYLHYLAQNRFFDDPRFVDYIEYLQYWRDVPYCLHIVFPHCLRVLELLQSERFVAALKRADFKEMLHKQQYWHWLMRADVRRSAPIEGAPQPPARNMAQ
jgi:mediator of RNA polymerase II transcription subunit 31